MSASDSNDIKKLLRARGICVIIPTYNNHVTIERVLWDVSQYSDAIIVVNDGSTDATSAILQKIPSITVVDYKRNRGKGYALKTGFKRALNMGFSYAITMDADGQHYAKDIPLFLEANMRCPGSLIVGNRRLAGIERSKGSVFANRFSNFWFYLQTGCHLSDTQTGYRLYPLKKLYGVNLLTAKYEAELALMVLASWHGVRLISIPIDVYYPPKDERLSHFRPYRDFVRISLLNIVLCILAVVYGAPLRLGRVLMTFLRTVYALVTFLFFSLVIIAPFVWIYTKICRNSEKRCRFLHDLIYKISRFIVLYHGIPGTKFRYMVDNNVCFDKPCVVICNHQSHFDLVCQLIFTPKIVFLTNDWVRNSPFYGLLIRNAEYLPVTSGIDALLPQIQNLVNRGYSIAIYPEGSRSKNGCIGRFHQGSFYIAQQLKLDILPMLLYGTGKVLPPKSYYLRRGVISISVAAPLTRKELDGLGDVRRQASEVHRVYVRRYEELKNSIEKDV